jgi:hypothetical protein
MQKPKFSERYLDTMARNCKAKLLDTGRSDVQLRISGYSKSPWIQYLLTGLDRSQQVQVFGS